MKNVSTGNYIIFYFGAALVLAILILTLLLLIRAVRVMLWRYRRRKAVRRQKTPDRRTSQRESSRDR